MPKTFRLRPGGRCFDRHFIVECDEGGYLGQINELADKYRWLFHLQNLTCHTILDESMTYHKAKHLREIIAHIEAVTGWKAEDPDPMY
jgi:hypothetical protein